MKLEMFINFDGNCREAVEFYAKVFNSKVEGLMTYGDTPPNSESDIPESDRNRVMHASVPIGGLNVMFSDAPSGDGFIQGNNICPNISINNKEEITRLYNELKEGGEVYVQLEATFFSELFCMVKDKFGIIWQLIYRN
ncbi:MAG: VOC family protein [Defluviitaleaceae bacterium]|nr:VOC family protein [Defluviitaleaceae bacterium]